MTGMQFVLSGIGLFTLAAAIVDFRTGHIPNRLTLFGACAGVGLHVYVHLALLMQNASLAERLLAACSNVALGAVVCGLVPLLLYRTGGMGGGDVKLLGTVGATCGPMLGLEIELYAFVLAALYAPARLAYQGQLLRGLSNSVMLLANPVLPKARRRQVPAELLSSVRFGPAVFVAALVVGLTRWWAQ